MPGLTVAVAPQPGWLAEAVVAGGGRVAPVEEAEALVWGFEPASELALVLDRHPGIAWVQLPSAGVEAYASLLGDGRVWTSAKGAFADPVAEHALALLLACQRLIPRWARSRTWAAKAGRSLFEKRVTIVGAGEVAGVLLELLRPFRVRPTVVRRRPLPLSEVPTLTFERLDEGVAGADAVVLAAALTAQSRGMIGSAQLRAMGPGCCLVNVGRGRLVRTDDLVAALREGRIAAAGLDVTDPEPLPDGHPLWSLDNCVITPHTANPGETERAGLTRRIASNVRARIRGEPLAGVVDPRLGY